MLEDEPTYVMRGEQSGTTRKGGKKGQHQKDSMEKHEELVRDDKGREKNVISTGHNKRRRENPNPEMTS